MSHAERYAWLSLIAWAAILFFLITRFTAGIDFLGQSFGLTIVEQSAGKLLWTYVTLAVIAIAAESVIAAVLAARAGEKVDRDERDIAIEARANLASYWFMAAALNVIVLHVLLNAAYGGHNLPQLNLTSLTGVAFALLFVLAA
ncbi:MAG: hypothetical protein ABL996_23535, partial [Micropepsaceae bacterium]